MLLYSVCCDFSSNTDLEITEEERKKGKEKKEAKIETAIKYDKKFKNCLMSLKANLANSSLFTYIFNFKSQLVLVGTFLNGKVSL